MIIYGTKATHLATENIYDKCTNCGTLNSINMSVFQKYVHIFWIPFFPINKTGVTHCSHCNQVLQKDKFTENLNNSYKTIKSNTKMPIWTFTGLALVFIATTFKEIFDRENNAKNAKLILAPQKGDIYEVKIDSLAYTLYKVQAISSDTVFILLNQYETNEFKGLKDIKSKGEEAFVLLPLPILKTKLKNMLQKGEIIDIDRK